LKGQTLAVKDIRNATITINGGKCTEANAGVILTAKIGLTEENDASIK